MQSCCTRSTAVAVARVHPLNGGRHLRRRAWVEKPRPGFTGMPRVFTLRTTAKSTIYISFHNTHNTPRMDLVHSSHSSGEENKSVNTARLLPPPLRPKDNLDEVDASERLGGGEG